MISASPQYHTYLGDASVGLCVARGLKGGVAHQALVTEHADAPQVHLLIVGVPLNHLWRKVVQCSTHCSPPGWGKKGLAPIFYSMFPENRASLKK